MPQIFKIGGYIIYFWINEGMPLEPIHVHVAEGRPIASGTKIWLTRTGGCIVQNNSSDIPEKKLNYIKQVISARHSDISKLWEQTFGEIRYYC